MKVSDVKSNTYVYFHIERIDTGLQFSVGNHVRISKYRDIEDIQNITLKTALRKFL